MASPAHPRQHLLLPPGWSAASPPIGSTSGGEGSLFYAAYRCDWIRREVLNPTGDAAAPDRRVWVEVRGPGHPVQDVLEVEWEGGQRAWLPVGQLPHDGDVFRVPRFRGDSGWPGSPRGEASPGSEGEVATSPAPDARERPGVRALTLHRAIDGATPAQLMAGHDLLEIAGREPQRAGRGGSTSEGGARPGGAGAGPTQGGMRGEAASRSLFPVLDLGPSQGWVGWDSPRPAASLGARVLVLLPGIGGAQCVFAELLGSPAWARLRRRYGEGIFAFDFPLLTRGPVSAALTLLEELPPGVTVDLVAHGHGVVVADLLCGQVPWSQVPGGGAEAEGGAADPTQASWQPRELGALERALSRAALKLGRVVRVGPAAGGQPHGDDVLERWLNLMEIAPVRGATRRKQLTELLLRRLAVEKAAPLPGALPEGSRLLKGLALFGRVDRKDIATLLGVTVPGGLSRRMAELGASRSEQPRGDLLIPLSSQAVSGVARAGVGAVVQEVELHHGRYFSSADVRDLALRWLEGTQGELLQPFDEVLFGLHPGGRRRSARGVTHRRSGAPAEGNRPLVFLLPGIMGSHLEVQGKRVWLAPLELFLGGMKSLRWEERQSGVIATDVVASAYQRLIEHLSFDMEVVPFPYDWRAPIEETAERLNREVVAALEGGRRPVYLLAHSMGGLVARALCAHHSETWKRVKAGSGRLVMLGTPNQGSWAPLLILLRKEAMSKALALWDVHNSLDALVELVRGFPGLMQMLPPEASSVLRCSFEAQGLSPEILDHHLRFWQGLDTTGDPAMLYVAGRAARTPVLATGKAGDGQEALDLGTAAEGDGRVLWAQSRLDGVVTYFMDAAHGDLCDVPATFDALWELLREGKTLRLDLLDEVLAEPGRLLRQPAAELELDNGRSDARTLSAEDVLDAVLGRAEVRYVPEPALPALQVSVGVGDARRLRDPLLLVGQYEGEGPHDLAFSLAPNVKTLRQMQRMGVFPGQLGSSRLFPHPERRGAGYGPDGRVRAGLLVVGLGPRGSLGRASLTQAICRALVEQAVDHLESGALELHSLILGMYADPRLGVDECVMAVLEGVLQANDRLRYEVGGGDEDPPPATGPWCFERLRLIEVQPDVAAAAARRVRAAGQNPTFGVSLPQRVVAAPTLIELEEGALQSAADSYRDSSYQTVHVELSKKSVLTYTISTQLARAEVEPHPIQWPLVEEALARALTHEQAKAVHALCYYLIPPRYIVPGRMDADMVLDLGPEEAQIPWELLHRELPAGELPMAARVGVVRKLRVQSPELPPRRARQGEALVIGAPLNPVGRLQGALEEAREVSLLLSRLGHHVTLLEEPTAWEVFQRLYDAEYDIIHITGHGRQVPGDLQRSGVLLEGNILLTSMELQTLRAVPRVVFINACHVGHVEQADVLRPSVLSASLSAQLITMGVNVVCSAGWQVDDAAAQVFARTFYQRLTEGAPLLSVAQDARHRTWSSLPQSTTWGAYQIYGDPNFSLLQGGDDPVVRRALRAVADMVSPAELETHLRRLLYLTHRRGEPAMNMERVVGQLREVRQQAPAELLTPQTLSALADAWEGVAAADPAQAPRALWWAVEAQVQALARLPGTAEHMAERLYGLEDRLQKAESAADTPGARSPYPGALARAERRVHIARDLLSSTAWLRAMEALGEVASLAQAEGRGGAVVSELLDRADHARRVVTLLEEASRGADLPLPAGEEPAPTRPEGPPPVEDVVLGWGAAPEEGASRRALLIGINHYPHLPGRSLRGCVNDVELAASVLRERFGFTDVTLLLDGQASRVGILDALQALSARCGEGDVIFVHYSGHGSQRPDRTGDEDDLSDETLVPSDSGRLFDPVKRWDPEHPPRPGTNVDIVDDELRPLLEAILARTPHLTVVLDCCHSGTGTRGDEGDGIRWIPPWSEGAGRSRSAPSRSRKKAKGPRLGPPLGEGLVLAACKDSQTAKERTVGEGEAARRFGAFSAALYPALRAAPAGARWGQVFAEVRAEVLSARQDQEPQLQGDGPLPGAQQAPGGGGGSGAAPAEKQTTKVAQVHEASFRGMTFRSGEVPFTLEGGGPGSLEGLVASSLGPLMEGEGFSLDAQVELTAGADRGLGLSTSSPLSVTVEEPAPGHAVVLLEESPSGALRWRIAEAERAAEGQLRFELPWEEGERGTGPLKKTILKLLVGRLAGGGAASIREVARDLDEKSRPYRLRRYGADGVKAGGLTDADWKHLASGKALLLIHGTFARTETSFEKATLTLAPELTALYQGRVFAFDHPSITFSPEENARRLLDELRSAGAKLSVDIIATSRGGLVARCLAGQWPGLDPSGQLTVDKVAFIGTPNRGTPLASQERLSALLSRLTTLAALLPGAAADLGAGVLFAVKLLVQNMPTLTSGLAAMDPDGAFLRELNLPRPGATPRSCLAVGADFEPHLLGSGGAGEAQVWKRLGGALADLAADGIIQEPNDLVVPTASVAGVAGVPGFPVARELRLGPDSCTYHLNYFESRSGGDTGAPQPGAEPGALPHGGRVVEALLTFLNPGHGPGLGAPMKPVKPRATRAKLPPLPHDDDSNDLPSDERDLEFAFIGRGLTAEEFTAYVKSFDFGQSKPDFLVLHHTASPSTLAAPNPGDSARWDSGEKDLTTEQIYNKRLTRLTNIMNYYKGKGWSSGPHLFIDDRWIWLFTPMNRVGTHAKGGNRIVDSAGVVHRSIGIEVVGYFETKTWSLPVAALVGHAVAELRRTLATFRIAYMKGPGGVSSHRDYNKPGCPGAAITSDYYIATLREVYYALVGARGLDDEG